MRRYHDQADHLPFFLVLGFTKPHLPFCAPRKYWQLYDRQKLPQPTIRKYPAGAPAYAAKWELGELNQYKPVPQKLPLDDQLERTLIHGYYASLSYMDAQLGRVLDELERLGLNDNTIVVLWGDHGYHLGDHGAWTKHTNYEQANRIPLVISAPGVTQPGSSTRALVESVDLFPTLVELAGLAPFQGEQPWDGTSLLPVLDDPQKSIRDHAYHCYPRGKRMGRAIRTARHRLVEWKEIGASQETAQYELYDYQQDPLETRNLAEEDQDNLRRLIAILKKHPEAKPAHR